MKTQSSDQGVEQADETEQANKEDVTSPDGASEQGEPVQGDDQQTSLEETNSPVTQEGEGNVTEQSGEEAVSGKLEQTTKVYLSVFLGWSLEAGKDSLTPQWKAGETVDVKALAEAAGVTKSKRGSNSLIRDLG